VQARQALEAGARPRGFVRNGDAAARADPLAQAAGRTGVRCEEGLGPAREAVEKRTHYSTLEARQGSRYQAKDAFRAGGQNGVDIGQRPLRLGELTALQILGIDIEAPAPGKPL